MVSIRLVKHGLTPTKEYVIILGIEEVHMKEIWKDIIGYEGEYQISNMGRVKSLIGRRERILKPRKNKRGYLRVSLHQRNDKMIHRLVAIAFLPNPEGLKEVNHKDENPSNNCVDNLEWCTHQYNVLYGTCQQRARQKQSETFPQINRADISKPVVCLETGTVYPSINEAERTLKLPHILISKVCRGIRKSTGGYTFKYLETH